MRSWTGEAKDTFSLVICVFLPWASSLAGRWIQLWASFSPSGPGCSSTLDPAAQLTAVPPLSAPVAPAEHEKRKKNTVGHWWL